MLSEKSKEPSNRPYARFTMWIEKTIKAFLGLVLLFIVVRHTPFVVDLIQQFIDTAAKVADSVVNIDTSTTDPKGTK